MIYSRDTLQTLPSISPDSSFLSPLDQRTLTLNYVQHVFTRNDQEQGSFISHVEGKSVEYMSYLSSLFQYDNLSFLVYHRSRNIDNLSNDSKPFIEVENLENHHIEIHVSTNTCGDECPRKLDDIFSSSKDLDLQGVNLKFISHRL